MKQFPIIPYPEEVQATSETFVFPDLCTLAYESEVKPVVSYFHTLLTPSLSKHLKLVEYSDYSSVSKKGIVFHLISEENLGEEGYSLTINEGCIEISAQTNRGLFYGIQTLRQLFPPEIENGVPLQPPFQILGCEIKDSPRFQWRGFMLDVGRHYHPLSTIKALLDQLALFKFNYFHWHLTEDQGWRIEIKRYPKLVEIGSKRKDTKIGGHLSFSSRGEPHEGHYTQEEVKEILAYAKERFITVIPEIELPGHSSAAIASYPELGCTGKQVEIPIKPGIYPDIYCAGKESTFEFLQNVLDEVCELFPVNIIHIGGDEAPKKRWKKCPACQQRIAEENLEDEHALQVYFTNRIAEYLKTNGKKIMGWNEILEENLDKDAIVQYWIRNEDAVINAMNQGREVVNSHFHHYYLDYKYVIHPLQKVYEYEPQFEALTPEGQDNLLGIECPLWTEWVPTKERLDWQVYPRLLAIAESAWSPADKKSYKKFYARIEALLPRLDALDIAYCPPSKANPKGIKRFFQFFTAFRWPKV